MAILLSNSTLASLRAPTMPAPDVTPQPQLGQFPQASPSTDEYGNETDWTNAVPHDLQGARDYSAGMTPPPLTDPLAQRVLNASPSQYAADLIGTTFDPLGALGAPDPGIGPLRVGQAFSPWTLGLPGAALAAPVRTAATVLGGGIGQQAADRLLPEDTNPLVRIGVDTAGAALGGALGHRLGGALETRRNPAPQPFPELSPDEAAATNAQIEQQLREQHYGGQQAGQVARTGEVAPGAMRSPDYTQTPEEVVAGNAAAAARGTGDVTPVDVVAQYYDPVSNLLQRIQDAKPLQAQNAELLSQFRSRQAGAFSGAVASGPGGREGALSALGVMRGAAERVSFEPLRDVMPPGAEDSLFDRVTSSPLRPFEQGNAVGALRDIMDGHVPTPYDLGQLERVFPGITRSLQKAKIVSPRTMPDLSLSALNNLVRSLNTVGDFAALGRLGPQAGLYDPQAFGKAWVTGYAKTLFDGEAVGKALTHIDDRALADGLPTVDEWRQVGLKTSSIEADPGGLPNLLRKVPKAGEPFARLLEGYRNFQRVIKPQMANHELQLRIAAGENPALEDVARGTNVVSGSTNLPLSDDANFLLRFPNWLAAQYELMGRAAAAPVRPSVTNQMALQSVSRLIVFGLGATAAVNALQDKPTQFRHGIPMANIPDFITEHVGMPKGTTIDLFGPLGEIAQRTIGVGTATVTGGPKGGAHALYQLYDSLASPIVRGALNMRAGNDAYGNPYGLKELGKEALPFLSDTFLGTDARSTATRVAGNLGLRLHEPSARDQFAQTLGKDSWDQLEPAQQHDYNAVHPHTEEQLQAADFTKRAQAQLAAAGNYLKAGQTESGQPFTPKDWRDAYHSINDALRNQKEGVYANAGSKPGSDPVLDGYYKALDAATNSAGQIDWDTVDNYRAALKPADNAYIDRNTGLALKDDPTVQQYRADSQKVANSGYWNIADAVAQDIAKLAGLPKVTNQATLERAAREQYVAQYGDDGHADAYAQRIIGRYNAMLSKEHAQFLQQHRDLIPLLAKWGYGYPVKATEALMNPPANALPSQTLTPDVPRYALGTEPQWKTVKRTVKKFTRHKDGPLAGKIDEDAGITEEHQEAMA